MSDQIQNAYIHIPNFFSALLSSDRSTPLPYLTPSTSLSSQTSHPNLHTEEGSVVSEVSEMPFRQIPRIVVIAPDGTLEMPREFLDGLDEISVANQEQDFVMSMGIILPCARRTEDSEPEPLPGASQSPSSSVYPSPEPNVAFSSEHGIPQSGSPPTPPQSGHVMSISRLPTEIIEKVFKMFIQERCPVLWSLHNSGCIPANFGRKGLHANLKSIPYMIRAEYASLLPLLSLSVYFYGIISRLLSGHAVYINGIRSFSQLALFEQRRTGKFFIIRRTPAIAGLFRKVSECYTPEMLENLRALRGSPSGIWPYRTATLLTVRTYDWIGKGTRWRMPRSYDNSWAPKGWDMFPGWLTGGSKPSGWYPGDDEPEHRIEAVNRPYFFRELKSLVIGPDIDAPKANRSLRPTEGPDSGRSPNPKFTGPSSYLMFRISNALGEASKLEKLAISGNIVRNSYWMIPKVVGESQPLSNLTHLTLSLTENPCKFDTPLQCLQKYITTTDECHLCNLLTGRNGHDGKISRTPFVTSLKHLHLCGPGAHVCSHVFGVDWEALDNVLIEMDTHRGICDGEVLRLLYAVDDVTRKRPQMSVEINVRICEPEFDKPTYSHHWWRINSAIAPSVEKATGLTEIVVLVKKVPGPQAPVYTTPFELDRLDNLIESEWARAMLAVSKISTTCGVDPMGMVYDEDDVWRQADLDEKERSTEDDSILVLSESIIAELQERVDKKWVDGGTPSFPHLWEEDWVF